MEATTNTDLPPRTVKIHLHTGRTVTHENAELSHAMPCGRLHVHLEDGTIERYDDEDVARAEEGPA